MSVRMTLFLYFKSLNKSMIDFDESIILDVWKRSDEIFVSSVWIEIY
jgi:hypothetical protein